MTNEQRIVTCIARVTATCSILGSSVIIYMIVSDRKKKLNQPCHRLLLLMSIFDVLQSTAIAVANAAFPKESDIYINEVTSSYGAKGNTQTCAIQGFCLMLGLAVPLYNSCLNIYYVLTIRYSMSSERFAKFEPAMHAIAILVPLSIATTFLVQGDIKPQYCACSPGSFRLALVISPIFSVCFLICISSMVCISWTVISQAKNIEKYTRFPKRAKTSLGSSYINDVKKETIKQALLYTLAFILTYYFLILSVFFVRFSDEPSPPFALTIIAYIFYPLQGFWNFLFYVSPGVKHAMKASSTKSYVEALVGVIFNPLSTKNTRGPTANSKRARLPVLTSNRSVKLGDSVGVSSLSCQAYDPSSEEHTLGRLHDAPKRLQELTNSCDKSKEGNIHECFTGLQAENQQDFSIDGLTDIIKNNCLLGITSKPKRLSSLVTISSILSPETLADLNDEYDSDDA